MQKWKTGRIMNGNKLLGGLLELSSTLTLARCWVGIISGTERNGGTHCD